MKGQETGSLPDNLRCNRTDGRQWRCRRRAMDGKKLCGIHQIQLRHRQHKEKVPESLKLKRKRRRTIDSGIRVCTTKQVKKRRELGQNAESVGVSEALDGAVKRMKLRKGDLQLDLIRSFLQRQVERRRVDGDLREGSEGELMRDLPNGLMSICSTPLPDHIGNAGSCRMKLGGDPSPSPFAPRRFRSKNIEPLPIGTMQIVPYQKNVENLRKHGRKKCHWCQKSVLRNLIKCSSCEEEVFCVDCIKQQYFGTEDEVRVACPVCRRACSCKTCLLTQSKDVECKDSLSDEEKVYRILHFHYLICKLLPVLEQINKDRTIELEVQAKMEGKAPSEVQIQQAEFGCCNKCCCNKCKNSIVDFHRSCQQCSYKLCLSCCQELQKCPTRMKSSELVGNQLLERNQIQKPKQKCDILSLPSSESFPVGKCGGCGHGFLELRSVFPLNWTKDLETSAEEIICCYDFPDTLDTSPSCSLCIPSDNKASGNKLVEAATREDPNDNFLYRTSVQDIDRDNLEHFQKHWAKGHPVIIRNVIRSSSELSWDPIVMFCTYLEKSIAKSENNYKAVRANGCLDWCEVEIGIRKIFSGSLEGQTNANMQHEMLKLKGWLSSHLFQEHFPAHYAEIVRVLPLQEYLNPDSGLLNLTANFPQELPQADCGPCIYISYGCSEEHIRSDSVTKLCYDSHDVVNILAHTADVPLSGAQFSKIKKLMKKYKARDQRKRTKTTSGWKISNKTKQKSLFPNQNLEAKWQDIIGGGTNLHQKDAVEEVFDSSVKNGTITHSDAYDSDSEATVLRGETSGSSSEDEESCSGHIGESNWFGNKPVADNTLGAQWDVFRRQDVPKLVEYLRRHSNEFRHSYGFPKHVVHPLLDKIFFLDTTDKLRLKEEFKIEPWSFVQHLGEAVIIPAGCPYQIKNLKSCINVVLEFVSPENVTECIQLIDELRLLPDHHKAKKGKLEVQKLSLYSISAAITEIRKLTSAEQS